MGEIIELSLGSTPGLNVERAVQERYSAASQTREAALCCPVQYDRKYLEVLPQELLERDYGCGDPSKYAQPGETVLDLGCGGGKICYIASQIVGPTGRVWGVDLNDDMLELARRHQSEISRRIGWNNVRFFKSRIQDLALNLERLESYLAEAPARDASSWLEAQRHAHDLRRHEPMIPNNSVDIVLSNCVLNLVDPADRRQLFAELHRVLRPGGRAVISDIVSDQVVPERLKTDPELWSGCISGAFVEQEFVAAFERAGFHGIELVDRQEQPWATIEGIEFRSMTVRAYKGHDGSRLAESQAVIYRGPWKSVTDDEGQVLTRGVPTAVSTEAFKTLTSGPYAAQVLTVSPGKEHAEKACCEPHGKCC